MQISPKTLRTSEILPSRRILTAWDAAKTIIENVTKRGSVAEEDLTLLGVLRGKRGSVYHPEAYCDVVSQLLSIRHALPENEQILFWQTKLDFSENRHSISAPIGTVLHESIFRENGLTYAEIKQVSNLLLESRRSMHDRIALAKLLCVLRLDEIEASIKGGPFSPERTAQDSLLFSKRFLNADPFLKERAHGELEEAFINRMAYNTCPDAEGEFYYHHEQGRLRIIGYILYDLANHFGLCLKTFSNAEGQIFLAGTMYGTTGKCHRGIYDGNIPAGIPWQPLRAWNTNNHYTKQIDFYASEYFGREFTDPSRPGKVS